MNDQIDSQLLRAYVEHRSEPAFAELVCRHVDFVYSAALRMVCDSHLAEDVTQGVFVALAKNATQLTDRPVLSGWLHRTAQNMAAQTVRTDVRRRAREQEAAAMNELFSAQPEAVWEHIAPHLDAALGELGEADRDALMLRYFERKSAREIAQTLGTSEDAAQKRVTRAVERLREFFANRGVTVGASELVVVVSANAVQAAPLGLAVTISTSAALAGTTFTTVTATATKTIAMTTLQKTLVTATVAVLAGAGIYEARQASSLRNQVQTLQQQQAPLAEQIQKLQGERDDATSKLTLLSDGIAAVKTNQSELLRLRSEVGQLQRQRDEAQQSPKPQPVRPPKGRMQARNSDARYLSKEDLANVGYATPLTALQTITWTLMNGSYEEVNAGLSPELREQELKNPQNREKFEGGQKAAAQMFTGMQILGQKNLSLDKVELKVKYDAESPSQVEGKLPEFRIQPMVRVGNEWKLGGNTRQYQTSWETEGLVFEYVP